MDFMQTMLRGLGLLLALATIAPAMAQTPAPQPSVAERLSIETKANRLKLDYDGNAFSGPAWDRLVAEGKAAQFFLLGEEHGIAENPKLAGQLFSTLAQAGYSKFVIEVSPPIATELDAAARKGVSGLAKQYARPGGEPAFFGMKEETEMLAIARAAVKGSAPVFWGVDYEVGGDRLLIAKLEAKSKPESARKALAALKDASDASWAKYASERNPQYIFSFSGDPKLVTALRDAWPKRDKETEGILDTLQQTLEINALWVAGKGYQSNVQRSTFMRTNLLKHWKAELAAGRSPRVFAKMGASHLMRGRNSTETYDIGTLAPELAAMEGGQAFSVLILPGKGSMTAVFDPVKWSYEPAPPKDGYMSGLDPIIDAAYPDAFTLIDLRPLRTLLGRWREGTSPELMRIVHGFDMVLVMSGSTPSRKFGSAP
jgi:hypothetical protein